MEFRQRFSDSFELEQIEKGEKVMSTRLTRTSLFVAALLALFINTSVLAQNGPGGTFSGRITGLTNSGSAVGAANGLSTAVGFAPAVESCKKVGPVLPSHVFVFEEPQVCLVSDWKHPLPRSL
jgi:hypothetical protein